MGSTVASTRHLDVKGGTLSVVGSDAGGATGAGGQNTSHGKLVSRSCTYQRSGGRQTLSCLDDYAVSCQAVLTPQ